MADVGVTLTAIDYSELTSTPFAFTSAASLCFDEACRKASPELLEPVMNVDIICPKDFVGDAMSQVPQILIGQHSRIDRKHVTTVTPRGPHMGESHQAND